MADTKKADTKATKTIKKESKPAKKAVVKTDAKKKAPAKKVVKKDGNLAVIETGGKQYLVFPGDTVKVEKLVGKEGGKVSFDKVLLTVISKDTKIGDPYLKGVKISAVILEQGRDKKITVLRYKPKVRYQKKTI